MYVQLITNQCTRELTLLQRSIGLMPNGELSTPTGIGCELYVIPPFLVLGANRMSCLGRGDCAWSRQRRAITIAHEFEELLQREGGKELQWDSGFAHGISTITRS
jgi:hypothetical protein